MQILFIDNEAQYTALNIMYWFLFSIILSDLELL